MIGTLLKKVFGSRNERDIKRIFKEYVEPINALEEGIASLSDEALQAKTVEFRQRIEAGETVDDLLNEAFAVCREGGKRALGMRHFDVQLIGGVALHQGRIAEMRTGEGKTLVATLPCYLNALAGKGVHVVTVNDYLARRDAEWMGRLYRFLGMTVGVIQHGLNDEERAEAYNADITYCTNNELGFDYLRDNMKFASAQQVQRLHYAIVDEVDSILIDEARTPLIISGPAERSTEWYHKVEKTVPRKLTIEEHYTVDEKARSVMLTEEGIAVAEEALGVENLYDPTNVELLHHVQAAMKAHVIFKKDVDYMVKEGKIVIVDEFTGRLMPGRRWSDGIHQAIEAKEGVKVENENQTLATITFQNFFRMYDKLSGMTGTADTEAAEFAEIYDLEVLIIPTNRPMIRDDRADLIYKTVKEKYAAIADEIVEAHGKGQPALVGTISIEKSEALSALLKARNIPHHVLNAKFHEKEAEIVSQAGRLGAVTIATNMAGRGTDIVLGGNPEMMVRQQELEEDDEEYQAVFDAMREQCAAEHEQVLAAGGLLILGTERHESRRIDNQLRGRAGRQGDPGATRFYLSLEDDLLRIFGGDRIQGLMERLGMEEGEPIEAGLVSRAIENAQRKVEAHNFDMRKHLLEYDDVMNKQREVIYDQRTTILKGDDLDELVLDMAAASLDELMEHATPEKSDPEEWDLAGLIDAVQHNYNVTIVLAENKDMAIGGKRIPFETVTFEPLKEMIWEAVEAHFAAKREEMGEKVWRDVQKYVTLEVLDSNWKDHLLSMDYLKEGIGLRGFAQKNPLTEYKREGMGLFAEMIDRIRNDSVSMLSHVHVKPKDEAELERKQREKEAEAQRRMIASHGGEEPEPVDRTVRRTEKKVGRNDPCPCGSGKKYKKCHGASER